MQSIYLPMRCCHLHFTLLAIFTYISIHQSSNFLFISISCRYLYTYPEIFYIPLWIMISLSNIMGIINTSSTSVYLLFSSLLFELNLHTMKCADLMYSINKLQKCENLYTINPYPGTAHSYYSRKFHDPTS